MSGTSPAIERLVFNVLPDGPPGITHQEVFDKVGVWSPITLRNALRQLREAGSVIRAGTHSRPLFYRAPVDNEDRPTKKLEASR